MSYKALPFILSLFILLIISSYSVYGEEQIIEGTFGRMVPGYAGSSGGAFDFILKNGDRVWVYAFGRNLSIVSRKKIYISDLDGKKARVQWSRINEEGVADPKERAEMSKSHNYDYPEKIKVYYATRIEILEAGGSTGGSSAKEVKEGKSLGDISLGMTEKEVLDLLGRPSSRKPGEGGAEALLYPDRKLTITLASQGDNKEVQWIYTESPDYKTHKGIKVGSSFEDLIAAYGTPYKTQAADKSTIILYCNGDRVVIQFRVRNGRVEEIGVLDMQKW